LLGALAKLPGPGSELRRPILVAWGQDRCLGGVLPGRAASKQALTSFIYTASKLVPQGYVASTKVNFLSPDIISPAKVWVLVTSFIYFHAHLLFAEMSM